MSVQARLTRTQSHYLDAMRWTGRLQCGWGGLSSTLTVRVLAERGLCSLREFGPADWEAKITTAGRETLEAYERARA